MLYEGTFSKSMPVEERANYQSEWCDVRDVAEAQLKVLQIPEAAGQRFLLAREPFNWLDWCEYRITSGARDLTIEGRRHREQSRNPGS